MFSHQRRSSSGTSIPSWLSHPGKVLLKCHVKNSKYDSDVDEVDLIEANPQYAYVRFNNGCETTVSTRYLAPTGDSLRTVNDNTGDILRTVNDNTGDSLRTVNDNTGDLLRTVNDTNENYLPCAINQMNIAKSSKISNLVDQLVIRKPEKLGL